MAITPTPASVSIVVGYKATVSVVSNEGNITSVVSSDASVATVSANLGGPTSDIVITAVHGFNASQSPVTINIQVFTASGSINIPVTVSGVTTGFVGSKLGFFSDDIGQLCLSDRINRWSKYKPMRSISPLTDAIIKSIFSGLDVPLMAISSIKTYVYNTLNLSTYTPQKKWTYLPPTASHIKRLDDFRGYAHGALPMFTLPNLSQGFATDGSNPYNVTISVARSQVDGGLVPYDIFGNTGKLGIALLNIDTPENGYGLVKVNTASLSASQSIVIDLANVPSATYVACLFVCESANGVPQLTNPTDAQVNAYSDLESCYPIEDGMLPCGVSNYYVFPSSLWKFPNRVGALASSPQYALTENLSNHIVWQDFANSFTLEPIVEPAVYIHWDIVISLYRYNSDFTDGNWRQLVGWYDTDGDPMSVWIRTVSGYLEFRLIYMEDFANPIMYVQSDIQLSTSIGTPTVVRLSNVNGSNDMKFGLWIDGADWYQTHASGYMTQQQNPPKFVFGAFEMMGSAPKGLEFTDMEIIAVESREL